MIYQYRDRYFKEYFHHGITDKEKVLEYIVYRALKQSHQNLNEQGSLYKIPNEQHLIEWTKLSKDKYTQFYRFISLSDNPQNTTYKTDNEEEEISKIISNKIQEFITKRNVVEHNAGYYFTREKEGEFINEEREYSFSNQQVGWPCIIYEFLEELERLEKQNQDIYKLKWIKVRIIRAINREPPDREELKKLIEICKANEKEIIKLKQMLGQNEHLDK